MASKLFKRICISACSLLVAAAVFLPTTKAEARGEAGVALAAGAGALFGSAIGTSMVHNSHRPHHCQRTTYVYQQHCYPQSHQQQQMRYVLNSYNPAFHQAWVEYVMIDLQGTLTPPQQNQLLTFMNERKMQMTGISSVTSIHSVPMVY